VNKLKKNLEKIERAVKIQREFWNFDHDEYMRGMANGLICAVAMMKNKDPEYIENKDKATSAEAMMKIKDLDIEKR
jgi:hypothetical protein